MINPGSKFPPFKTIACVSVEPGYEFESIASSDYAGKWLVLYTYPKDFTFICPTEILAFDAKVGAFEERGAVVLGGSTDNEHSHLAWRNEHPGLRKIRHPLLYISPRMSEDWGVAHPVEGVLTRATLIIDPDGVVRFVSANDLDVGRNVAEVLRVLDALKTGELCQCTWEPGDETLTQTMKA